MNSLKEKRNSTSKMTQQNYNFKYLKKMANKYLTKFNKIII